jgi:hypothetical protein
MGGLNLGTPATIDQAQPCNRATFAISAKNVLSEIAVAHDAVGQLIDTVLRCEVLKGQLRVLEAGHLVYMIDARQKIIILPKSALHNPREILCRERPYRSLSTPGNVP